MKKPIPYPEARRVLSKVPRYEAFWLCTNQNLRGLADISKALESVDDDVFRYHVTRDKNDFEAWIKEVLKDKELAREIARVKTKETLIRKINERVNALRKVTDRHKSLTKRKETRSRRKAKKGNSLKKPFSKSRKKQKKKVSRKASKPAKKRNKKRGNPGSRHTKRQ